jgi:hypothetical protein
MAEVDELMSYNNPRFLLHGSLHGDLHKAIGHLRLYQQLGGVVDMAPDGLVAIVTYSQHCVDAFADSLIHTLRTIGEETQVHGKITFGREHLEPSILHIGVTAITGASPTLRSWLITKFLLKGKH